MHVRHALRALRGQAQPLVVMDGKGWGMGMEKHGRLKCGRVSGKEARLGVGGITDTVEEEQGALGGQGSRDKTGAKLPRSEKKHVCGGLGLAYVRDGD